MDSWRSKSPVDAIDELRGRDPRAHGVGCQVVDDGPAAAGGGFSFTVWFSKFEEAGRFLVDPPKLFPMDEYPGGVPPSDTDWADEASRERAIEAVNSPLGNRRGWYVGWLGTFEELRMGRAGFPRDVVEAFLEEQFDEWDGEVRPVEDGDIDAFVAFAQDYGLPI